MSLSKTTRSGMRGRWQPRGWVSWRVGSSAAIWTHSGSRMDDGRAGTRPPMVTGAWKLRDHHGSCLPCSTTPTGAGPKCSVLEVHGCKFRLIGSWWAEAARQEAGAPGSGGHGPARAERALPVRQRTQSEALLWGAAGAVRGGAGQGVLVPAGPL